MRVLIVDDSRAMRSIIRDILQTTGIEVVEAANGREAMGLLGNEGWFDLALIDWNMPVMSGIELVQAIRADPRYAALPLVMVTSESELSMVQQALEAGANEYIMKPFTEDILLTKIEMLGTRQDAG